MFRRSLIIITIVCGAALFAQAQIAEFKGAGANSFGAQINEDGAKELSAVVPMVEEGDTLSVALAGTIHEVCQAKGCWMTLEDEEGDNSVFIKFKDYAFFVPLEAGGKKAVISGKLYASITPVAELRHYAEDKGATKEEIAAITEPTKELKMMADGVVIYND